MSTTRDTPVEVRGDPAGATSATGQALHVVCLSTQPWRVDLPTNRQQIMTRVAEAGHDVLYVDTGDFVGRHIGSLVRSVARRSILRQLVGVEVVAPRVRAMIAPSILPWGHRFRLAARINAALTAWLIRRRRKRGEPVVLWLYDPWFADCIGKTGERLAVYDCVDDYAEQADPSRRARTLELDTLAASRARIVFATATTLAERHGRHNARTHLVPNVGDFAHFAPAADRSLVPSRLADLSPPVIGFAGNFHPRKIDLELLEKLARQRPEWTMVLIGPAREATEQALGRLARLGNVHWLGAVSYDDLPRFVAAFDVALIPYRTNAYTRSCFPLKTYEYLAAGKAVVASGLPELRGMEPDVVVVDDGDLDGFSAAIERALDETSQDAISSRQARAAANTWETRSSRLLDLIAAEL